MTLKVKNAGSWATVQNLYYRQNGVWVPVQKAFIKQAGVWVEAYAAEVVVTLSANVNNLNIQNLFTAADWASSKKKRVVVAATTIIGSTTPAGAALSTGTGRGGFLQIDNFGFIHGAGGAANSGTGGDAINIQQLGTIINNAGYIRGGGGGGGIGGTGGQGGTGYYIAADGEQYNGSSYTWSYNSNGNGGVYWAGTRVAGSPGSGVTSVTNGSYTYYRGSQRSTASGTQGSWIYYGLSRQYPVYVGGAGGGGGGNGGQGQGSNQSRTNGLGGAGGGNNGGNSGVGGTGGTGGAGGDWATPGATGNTGNPGASGNYTGGSAGYAGGGGGAAGRAITGLARTLNNSGTIQGAT